MVLSRVLVVGLPARLFTLLLASALSVAAFAATNEQSTRPEAPANAMLSAERRGDVLMANRNYAAAIDAYRSAPQQSAVIWNKLGIAYHHLFALQEARKDYEQALALDPHFANAMNNLGAVYYGERNYRRAERYYKKALKIESTSATMYSNLGTAYFAQHKFKEGARAYEKAFALDPKVFDPDSPQNVEEATNTNERAMLNYSLAKMYAQAGKPDRALMYLRKALDEGFKDRKKLLEDKEFANMRDLPEFKELVSRKPDTVAGAVVPPSPHP